MAKRWRTVHGNMRSRNAQEAEDRGEMPLTRAVEAVYLSLDCKKHNVSRREVREFLVKNCACGWHHVAAPTRVQEVQYYATSLTDEHQRQLLGTVTKDTESAV